MCEFAVDRPSAGEVVERFAGLDSMYIISGMREKQGTAGDIASNEWSVAIVARSAPNEKTQDLRDVKRVYRGDPDRWRC